MVVTSRTRAASGVVGREIRFLLVVDSNMQSLSFTSMLLRRFNYQVFKAASGREALETAATALPFLIITSLHLPDMHGFDLIQQFKGRPLTAAIPLIALSSQDDLRVKKHCLGLGAVDCLTQPVAAEQLYRAVQLAGEQTPRTSMRIRTNQSVQVAGGLFDAPYNACALELSERGMFLRTAKPVVRDARLSASLTLDGRVIPTEASVLYQCTEGAGPCQEPGMGVQFVRIAAHDQEHIRRFIRNEVMRDIASRQGAR